MPRLSLAQEAARQRVARLAERGLLPEPLADRLLAALRPALGGDYEVLLGVDPHSLLYNRLLAVSAGGLAEQLHRLQHAYLVSSLTPALSAPGLMRAGVTAGLARERIETSWGLPPALFAPLTGAQWARHFHEVFVAKGGVLLGAFAARGRWVATLGLTRFEATAAYRPTDIAFLRTLAPAIGRLLQAALDREQAGEAAGRVGPEAAGVLVLGPDRRVRLQTPAAAEWLGLLRHTRQPAAPGGVQLPTAVWAALARLAVGPEWELERAVLVPTPAGPLRVEASPAGEDGSVAVVLTPQRPPAPVDLPAAWPLTGRERDVLALVARGLGNAAVAAALGVGEHTVESHLGHAYEKLGVHSRTQFLARLFREAYWPTFRSPEGPDPAG